MTPPIDLHALGIATLAFCGAFLVLWGRDRRYAETLHWSVSHLLIGFVVFCGLPAKGQESSAGNLVLTASSHLGSIAALFFLAWGILEHQRRRFPITIALVIAAVTLLVVGAVSVVAPTLGWDVVASIFCVGFFGMAALLFRGGRAAAFAACFMAARGANGVFLFLLGERYSPALFEAIAHALTLGMGLSLLIAVMNKMRNELLVKQKTFEDLVEGSLQGLVILQGDRTVLANSEAARLFGHDTVPDFLAAGGFQATSAPGPESSLDVQRHWLLIQGEKESIEWTGARMKGQDELLSVRARSSRVLWGGEPAEQVVLIDQTSQIRAMDRLRQQATHDQLTGLPNRFYLSESLAQATDVAKGMEAFGVMILDLDRFGSINDTLGHDAGDQVLATFAQRLKKEIPEAKTIARFGGDEFALVIDRREDEQILEVVAHRIARLAGGQIEAEGRALVLDVSMGIAVYPRDGRTGAALLSAADTARVAAKTMSGSHWVFHDAEMNRLAERRTHIEHEMRNAVARREEFFVVYQPKVAAVTHRLTGFEALLRWQSPKLGFVSPGEFIPVAEETGLIISLGEMVLELVCEQIALWKQDFGEVPPVAVNLSPRQAVRGEFPDQLLDLLNRHHLRPDAIEVELTESGTVGCLNEVLPIVARLRSDGIALALDDFGTGQSSLSYLQRLPITTLKVDRSFVQPLPDPGAKKIAHAICALAMALEHHIVAEGIETEEQAQIMEELGCHTLQGFLFGRPLPVDEAADWIRESLVPDPAH